MYNVTDVTESLRGLVGFRPHYDQNLSDLESDVIESRSGLWLDKAHPLLTAQILTKAALLAPPKDENGNSMADEDPLSFLIRQTLDDSVAAVVSGVVTRKLLRGEAKRLLKITPLYDGEGSISDLIQPANRFVGLRISMQEREFALQITKLGLQFTGPVTNLPIYIISGESGEKVLADTVSTTYSGRMQWLSVNITLAGSTVYYIGYDEADLPSGVQAVRRSKSIGDINCGGCSPENNRLWGKWKPFYSISAVRQDNDGDPFDTIKEQNYGINLYISVGCDFSDILIEQQLNLAEAIRQQAVVKLLNELAYSPLITTVEQQVKQNAMYALETTERPKLEKLLDALDIDLSGLSSKCLPDTQDVGRVRRTTLWNR
ncbi:hypothetical protein IC229_33205 [Spirosoma sp. BT702]|uniref:Uncharacterized protein n=1 Tax=Spirosoma profusum TaxID=2771354 RepID=A0A927GAE2_9BACT|nr:hypothetical protein [Spirosoma profusum]MBD2705517.1 hypothetical protein [Spirosoma profusum]